MQFVAMDIVPETLGIMTGILSWAGVVIFSRLWLPVF